MSLNGVNPYDSISPNLSEFTCIGLSVDVNEKINLCLDISDFEEKLKRGGQGICFE